MNVPPRDCHPPQPLPEYVFIQAPRSVPTPQTLRVPEPQVEYDGGAFQNVPPRDSHPPHPFPLLVFVHSSPLVPTPATPMPLDPQVVEVGGDLNVPPMSFHSPHEPEEPFFVHICIAWSPTCLSRSERLAYFSVVANTPHRHIIGSLPGPGRWVPAEVATHVVPGGLGRYPAISLQ